MTVVESEGRAELPEIGFVAGRRVGNAVRRNRAKRRLRAAATEVPFRTGRAYVVIAAPDVPERPFTALVDDLRTAVRGGV